MHRVQISQLYWLNNINKADKIVKFLYKRWWKYKKKHYECYVQTAQPEHYWSRRRDHVAFIITIADLISSNLINLRGTFEMQLKHTIQFNKSTSG